MSLKYDKRHQTKGRKTFKTFLSHSIVGNVPLVELAFVLVIALVFYVVASSLTLMKDGLSGRKSMKNMS